MNFLFKLIISFLFILKFVLIRFINFIIWFFKDLNFIQKIFGILFFYFLLINIKLIILSLILFYFLSFLLFYCYLNYINKKYKKIDVNFFKYWDHVNSFKFIK